MHGGNAADQAVTSAMLMLAGAATGGTITAAAETQLQNAIDLVRRSGAPAELLPRLEQMAVDLRTAVNAKIYGRTNLLDSRLARIRRALAS
ncbi:hypothetical protein E2493_14565 [Sphingomonas parva]|uniref:Uncharacterized protein n=1 Tax=Sphingomonas parva TaxID=2555898 RepID=A0A4Y8ZR39_9SPHN|nr:hypothetical protein [Sphingomonas parva]TFI57585.1 hypothetical protein E2493_14565 [Sphingomonas parva]